MKNNLKVLFITLLSFLITALFAQTKLLNINEFLNKDLYPKQLNQLQWIGKTNKFTYVAKNCIVEGTIGENTVDTILQMEDLNDVLAESDIKEMVTLPQFKWVNESTFRFLYNNTLFTYDIPLNQLVPVVYYNEKAENIDIAENSLNIAYTIDNNLYISGKSGSIQVTNDNDKGIVNGKSVHRDEFGITKGTFWSPKGDMLAFYRMDETMVTDYPLVNIDTRIAEVKNIKYPMAGMKSHEVTVGVFDTTSKKTIFLKTGEPKEQYLTNISWSPDEKYIYIAVLNRDQNHMKLNKYDVSTGDFIKTLFEEENDNWVEPLHGLTFLNKNPNQFVWQSKRDGYNHLYLYDSDGKMLKQLTKGEWEVTELLGFSRQGNELFYISNEDSPIERQVYSVDLNTGRTLKLTSVKGTHNAAFSYNSDYFFDSYNNQKIAGECKIMSSKGKEVQTLLKNSNPLEDYKIGETSVFTIKADDGTDLYCRLIKPADFNPVKKYPVLLYVYGGPHSQLVSDTWLAGAGLFLNYCAAQGYVVFTLDNRGTSFRGLKFEQAISRNLGDLEAKDQMKGIEYLKALPYVDGEKLAVHGWSYGGFMTISLLEKYPGVFKAAVAGGPVIDWKYYEVMYGERYMDTPEQNPEGYENASLLNHVNKIDAKLLIIHGTMDNTVVWQHSLLFVKKCIDEGVQIDYFVYPDHEHNVAGKDRLHLYHKIFDYINDKINAKE